MSDSDLAALRPVLVAVVRSRVPPSDVDDVVQATLADAVAAKKKPENTEERRAWLFGIARHKIADYHRSRRRESPDEDVDLPDSAPHHSERDLLRWAEQVLPEGEEAKKTLEWMLREGDGEKLESIAEAARVPAPTVRKRVSRLREHFRAQWKRELALVAAASLIIAALAFLLRTPNEEAHHDVTPKVTPLPPSEVADALRMEAVSACNREEYAECTQKLDRAKDLDPSGENHNDVKRARAAIEAAKHPAPIPSAPSSVPAPTASFATPPPTATPTATPTAPVLSSAPFRSTTPVAPTPKPSTPGKSPTSGTGTGSGSSGP